MSFQKQVYAQPAPAVEGDFASVNPRASVLAIAAALVAGENGATVGRFGWIDGNEVNNTGTGTPNGFISRRGNHAVITQWLGKASMLIPAGMNITLHSQGEFWVRTSTAATIGQKIFASTTDGTVQTGAAGDTISGYVETNFSVATVAAAGELVAMTTWAAV